MRVIRVLLAITAAAMALGACAAPAGSGYSLPGTKWELVSLNGATPVEGTIVTLFFATDNKAGGNAGCNTYNTTYKVDGSSLTFDQAMSTMMACEPAIMDQEQAYLQALGNTRSYSGAADKLVLKDGSGKELAVFAPYQPSSLEGNWEAIGINNGKQAVQSVMAGTTVTAIFGSDGKVSGNDGCNTYNGTYTIDGDKISIGPLATTRMACKQEVMDQATNYQNALANATTFSVGKGTLELRDANGALQVDYLAQK